MTTSSSRPDPSTIPVLTEVVELPLPAEPASPTPVPPATALPSAPPTPAAATTPAPPAPSNDDALDAVRRALLDDLKARLDPWLEQRVREHLDQAVGGLTASLTRHLHDELDQLLDEALNKELIRQEAQRGQDQRRERNEPDGGPAPT